MKNYDLNSREVAGTLVPALRATLESAIVAAMLGGVLFYPFLSGYHLHSKGMYLFAGGVAGGAIGIGLGLVLLLPLVLGFRAAGARPGVREVAGTGMILAVFGELLGWLVVKGFVQPGNQGGLFLFGLFMLTMICTWTFALRFNQIQKLMQP